jgi:hypothetical protein
MAELLNVENVLGILSIVLQVIAAYFAYQLIKITGAFRAWTLIIMALILMTLRRITALLITAEVLPKLTGTMNVVDRLVLPFLISVFLVWGMYDLLRLFEEHKVRR